MQLKPGVVVTWFSDSVLQSARLQSNPVAKMANWRALSSHFTLEQWWSRSPPPFLPATHLPIPTVQVLCTLCKEEVIIIDLCISTWSCLLARSPGRKCTLAHDVPELPFTSIGPCSDRIALHNLTYLLPKTTDEPRRNASNILSYNTHNNNTASLTRVFQSVDSWPACQQLLPDMLYTNAQAGDQAHACHHHTATRGRHCAVPHTGCCFHLVDEGSVSWLYASTSRPAYTVQCTTSSVTWTCYGSSG